MSIYQGRRWFLDISKESWCLTKPGEYGLGERPELAFEVDGEAVEMLIKALDDEGWIKPRLDERLRTEDLKITHRLLTIIEKQIEGSK